MRRDLGRWVASLRGESERAAAREFSWLSVGNQLTAVSALVATAVLAHAVTVPELGRVAFAQAFAAVVLLVVDVRFDDAIQRYYPILLRGHDAQVARAFYWRMFRWDVGLGLVIVVLSLTAWVAGLVPDGDVWDAEYVTIALVAAGLGTVGGTVNAGYAVTSRLADLGRRTSAMALLTLVLAAGGALTFGGAGYLVAYLVASAATVGVCLAGLSIPWERPTGDALPPGLPGFLAKSSASSSLALGTDAGILAIAGLTGSSTFVAYAKVAQAPGRVVTSLFSPIAVQAFPRISRQCSVGDLAATRRVTGRLSRGIAVAVLVMLSLAAPVLQPLVGLVYGYEYEVVALAAFTFMAGAGVRAVVAWSKVLPLAAGRPGLRLVVVAVESAVLVVAAALCASAADERVGLLLLAGTYAALGVLLAACWLLLSQGQYLYRRAVAAGPVTEASV